MNERLLLLFDPPSKGRPVASNSQVAEVNKIMMTEREEMGEGDKAARRDK